MNRGRVLFFLASFCLAGVAIRAQAVARADEPANGGSQEAASKEDSSQTQADKAALVALQSYIGGWKGVGQPQRGSNKGAWAEQADWAWNFTDERASIAFDSPRGKFFAAGRFQPGDKESTFVLLARRPDSEAEDRYAGKLEEEALVFTLEAFAEGASVEDRPARITIRQVADGKRLVVLYEKQIAGTDRFLRMAEVGYTREGSNFASANTGQPECVVTGGLGTIEVKYEGKTYYVCCTGCRDYFLEDPVSVLADYKERKEKERQEKEQKKGE